MMHFLLIQFLAALFSGLTLPADGTSLHGHASTAEFEASSYSTVTDLSWIEEEGVKISWQYILRDSVVLENRLWQWRLYRPAADTLLLNHIESSRERSDFSIAVPPGRYIPSASAFTARSRRDMAFVYADTGTVAVASFYPRTVILSAADTLRDCRLDSVCRIYRRTLAPADTSIATVTETEMTWRHGSELAPLATVTSRTVHTDGRTPVTTYYSAVFPPSMQDDAAVLSPEAARPKAMMQKAPSGKGPDAEESESSGGFAPAAPAISIDGDILTAAGCGPVSVMVCDIAGRIRASGYGEDSCTMDISSLPAGEYVVSVTCSSKTVSRTIMTGR